MLTYVKFFALLMFLSSTVWAEGRPAKNDLLQRFHKRNSTIRQLLSPNKPQNIKLISSKLKSQKDKRLFEQLATSKKGKKVEFYSLLSKFTVYENGKNISFELLSVKPLVIRKQDGLILQIDEENISDSIFKKNSKSVFFEALIPKSHAGIFGSDEDQWTFLYASAQVGGFTDQWGQELGEVTTQEELAKDIAAFIKHYDIKKFNCTKSIQGSNKGQPLFGVSFENTDGGRYVYDCTEKNRYNCGLHPVDQKGSVSRLQERHQELSVLLREQMQNNARKVGRDPRLDVNDFELSCQIDKGILSNSNECHLIDRNYKKYTYETTSALLTTNMLTSEMSEAYEKEIGEYIEASKQLSTAREGSGTGKDSTVIAVLSQCCQDQRCSTEIQQKTDMKMENRSGPIVQ